MTHLVMLRIINCYCIYYGYAARSGAVIAAMDSIDPKKGKNLVLREDMTEVTDHDFYLYRNCIYNLRLKSGGRYMARLIDIQRQPVFFKPRK